MTRQLNILPPPLPPPSMNEKPSFMSLPLFLEKIKTNKIKLIKHSSQRLLSTRTEILTPSGETNNSNNYMKEKVSSEVNENLQIEDRNGTEHHCVLNHLERKQNQSQAEEDCQLTVNLTKH